MPSGGRNISNINKPGLEADSVPFRQTICRKTGMDVIRLHPVSDDSWKAGNGEEINQMVYSNTL
jgi:hypothetical protein